MIKSSRFQTWEEVNLNVLETLVQINILRYVVKRSISRTI